MNSVFVRRFEKLKWSLKIVRRSLKICYVLLKRLLAAVSFTNLKTGGLSKLLNGSSSQTFKNTDCVHDCKDDRTWAVKVILYLSLSKAI